MYYWWAVHLQNPDCFPISGYVDTYPVNHFLSDKGYVRTSLTFISKAWTGICDANVDDCELNSSRFPSASVTEKAFKCNQCDSEFTRKASLNRHVKAAHDGQVISCPLCPMVFSYRNTLEDHKKAVHNEGRREYGCDLCGVQFAVKAYLSKHMVSPNFFP